MKRISLSEYLNTDNKWTARILGSELFKMDRNAGKIEQEYGREKWGEMQKRKFNSVEEAKEVEFDITISPNWRTLERVASFGDELFSLKQSTYKEIYFGLMKSKFSKYKGSAYCELGCGYGYNLSHFPEPRYGGEFTEAGVAVGKSLGFDLQQFDFYNLKSYGMIRPGSVVFTIQALEQIPDSKAFLDGMRSQKQNIKFALHLEGSFLPERKNLLGLFRNRYQEINDYNRNLVTLLKSSPDVEILELETDLIGAPALNSLHFIAWRFKN